MRLTFFISVLWIHFATALNLDQTKILNLKLSSRSLSRLSLEFEKIQDIFLYPGNRQDSLFLHTSGDLFISPSESFSLTLMGDKGTKQDLYVSFEDKDPEPILLKVLPLETSPNEADLGRSLLKFRGLSEEERSKEFLISSFKEISEEIYPAVTFKNSGAYEKGNLKIHQGSFLNRSDISYCLRQAALPFVKVMVLEKEFLEPGESMIVYYIEKGESICTN